MIIRQATIAELPQVMTIIEGARQVLKEAGSPQWQNGYGPDEGSLLNSIKQGVCYVADIAGGLVATACLIPGVDPVYTAIQEGQWQGSEPYLSIHRLAVAKDCGGKGIGKQFLPALVTIGKELGFQDLRIDTYPENQRMIRVIEDAGFTYRGRVYFPIPDGERVAYQIVI